MLNYCHNLTSFSIIVFLLIFSFGCSSTIDAPKRSYSGIAKDTAKAGAGLPSQTNESQIDLEQESAIEKMCLESWRKSIAGNKKGAISDLKKLRQQYPKSSTVLFMTGQVLERFGDKKEAMTYYEKASNDSDFAIMSQFKIAESLRTTGNTEQALIHYRRLVSIAPDFSLAHLGLAKILIKVHPEEAKKELKTVLELDPNNKEAALLLNSVQKL